MFLLCNEAGNPIMAVREVHRQTTAQPLAGPTKRQGPTDLRSSGASNVNDMPKVLAAIGSKLRIAQNQTIFSEGEPVDHAYKIVNGVVRLCKHLPDGRRQIAQFLFPGDYLSFIKLDGHSFSAEGVSDVVLISFAQTQIEQLCQKHPELRSWLVDMLSGRVRDIQNHLTMVGRQTAKERVASFLLLLSERFGPGGESIAVPMSRQDMADYLGLTMETISRILSLFKARRIITLPDLHRLEIVNLDALHALADTVE
jgi:CRP/FNR family transcriptional regulator, anaerobic regulatory protein